MNDTQHINQLLAALRNDQTLCCDAPNIRNGHHALCDVASHFGHASAHATINAWNAWGMTVAEVAEMLAAPVDGFALR